MILCAGEKISDIEIGKVGSGERDHVPLRGTRANECYPLSSTVFTHGHNQRDDAFYQIIKAGLVLDRDRTRRGGNYLMFIFFPSDEHLQV